MRAGLLRYIMVLQKRTETRPAMGAVQATYTDLAPVRCNVVVTTGTFKNSDSQFINSQVVDFTVRYNIEVNEEMRIKYEGRIYKILFISPDIKKGSKTIVVEFLSKV